MTGLTPLLDQTPRSQRTARRHQGFIGFLGRTLVSGVVLALLPGAPSLAQSVSNATVTEILDSNQVYIQNQPAQVNSIAQFQQRVRTQSARASLRFNTGAVARLAHNSSLVVGQCAQLNRGTLLVTGSLNGCSTTTVAGVRGTIYTLAVTEEGQTVIQVFEGEVVVTPQSNPPESLEDLDPWPPAPETLELTGDDGPPDAKTHRTKQTETTTAPPATSETVTFDSDAAIVVAEGQRITVDTEQQQATIAALTPEDFINLLEGPLIQGFVELPGIGSLRGVFQRLFPGIPLPFGLPAIPVPSLRFPF
ncbi:MAG TPA: hypothetical protein IGR64_01160 [Leptolyngbyaceae cyanobacterium M65_K2018_010]|nr:hypothetical protein [Leptolyngbyaceae cyanobacterium M65_K2018_010]